MNIVRYVLVYSLIAFCVAGAACVSTPQHIAPALEPTNGQISVHTDNAITLADAIKKAFKRIIDLGQALPEAQPIVDVAVEGQRVTDSLHSELVTTKELVKVQAEQIVTTNKLLEKTEGERDDFKGKLTTANNQRDAAVKKYDQSWFGGKFWRLVTWVLTIGGILMVVAFLLNLHTDIFLWPAKIVGKLLGFK